MVQTSEMILAVAAGSLWPEMLDKIESLELDTSRTQRIWSQSGVFVGVPRLVLVEKYLIVLPLIMLYQFPTCWQRLCETGIFDLDMTCPHVLERHTVRPGARIHSLDGLKFDWERRKQSSTIHNIMNIAIAKDTPLVFRHEPQDQRCITSQYHADCVTGSRKFRCQS